MLDTPDVIFTALKSTINLAVVVETTAVSVEGRILQRKQCRASRRRCSQRR